ncbi:glycine betaine ABC transporter substrate-binding protein [Sediminivirga luteola]|uniref:Glycine/betaine ABC transporter substrate-binding protein n=1 Tax=Sediminivirga luteola TaxID=1774748 RepID=A0A8J2TZU2_9MICO|nr:glycine betaine ABC transporter substrate-binding protein [Sediminivirga luteola]MCI2265183.1 glycine betaine ABC transporter substrate-binding protein [Sediminivirga luteola]GGA22336.1 glycine/betaine ABC transporter substrate-binding protein [Sediminivirga luteola]
MRTPLPLIAVLAGGTLLAGCGLGDAPPTGVSAGSLAEAGDLSDVTLTVGGKEFTEQLILCELAAQSLESAGAEAGRECGMSGSNTVRAALEGGSIDLYWEYTGTGWINYLGETEAPSDPQELYETLAERDAENGVSWLAPSPANNTYAVAVNRENAEEFGVQTLSDYAALANEDPEAASFCGAAEFFGREDGWPGLQEAYGFELPGSATSELALGVIYNSVDNADPCNFGEVFATDGRNAALDLVVLEDDQQFFTAYNPSVSVRSEVLEQTPQIADVLAPVSEALDDDTLQALNARVDVDGDTPEQVVTDWLRENGFIGD